MMTTTDSSPVLAFSQQQQHQPTRQTGVAPLHVAAVPLHQRHQQPFKKTKSQQKQKDCSPPSSTQQQPKQPKQSLYQILGVSPTASRSELKARYIALARDLHPDSSSSNDTTTTDQFTAIATAYKLLSDTTQRRVYDRSLAAEAWSESIAAAVAAKAVQPSVQALEQFALPLLRRTTATTLAGLAAAATSSSSSQSWWQSAASAVAAASQSMDCMELLEEAERLENQAVERYQEAVVLQQELADSAVDRLAMTLHTEESGLTAAEAELLLDHYDVPAGAGTRIPHQVQALQKKEAAFLAQQRADQEVQEFLQQSVHAKLHAETYLSDAQAAEQAAWAAYQEAQREAMQAQQQLLMAAATLAQAERETQTSADATERFSIATAEQSERVRKSLLQHTQDMFVPPQQQQHGVYNNDDQRRRQLDALREHERALHADASAIELQAAKLLSQSNKLKRRAELLEARRQNVSREP